MMQINDLKLPLRSQIASKVDHNELATLNKPLRTLRRLADDACCRVNVLKPRGTEVRDRKAYMIVNAVMKPVLIKAVYRSLAHFERRPGHRIKGNRPALR